jgi:diadenosine tetraphosphate (Ap4A) HIT family hydrolase
MKPCPFCDIPAQRLIVEDDLSFVIFSNPRLTKGHLLVIPKRHVEAPWELTLHQEHSQIFQHLHRLQKRLAETLGTGCDVRQNYRPFLIQGRLKVDHVHYHLIPRTFEDELYKRTLIHEKEVFADVSEQEMSEVIKLLRE